MALELLKTRTLEHLKSVLKQECTRVASSSFLLISMVNLSSQCKIDLSKGSFERKQEPRDSNITDY